MWAFVPTGTGEQPFSENTRIRARGTLLRLTWLAAPPLFRTIKQGVHTL